MAPFEFPNPFRRHRNIVQEAVDAKVESLLTERAGLRRERGLSVAVRTLSDHVVRRPYAGKKSKRTHARTWV